MRVSLRGCRSLAKNRRKCKRPPDLRGRGRRLNSARLALGPPECQIATIGSGARPAGAHAGRRPLLRREKSRMKIRPLQDRILVKRIEEEEKTKGGIIIPDTAKEKPTEGKVIAVGKGKVLDDGKLQPLEIKKGDRILFNKYSGTEVQVEGEEHLIIREDDVLGICE